MEIELTSDHGVSRNNLAWHKHPVIREITKRKILLPTRMLQAPGGRSKLGLVVEGGAMRGAYSAGALVALEPILFT